MLRHRGRACFSGGNPAQKPVMSYPCLSRLKSRARLNGWAAAWLVLLAGAVAAQAFEPGRLYTRGPSEIRRIALTFDDGPGPETARFLAMLDRHGVKATFFLLGEAVERQGALAREIVTRGHEVASHSSTHRNYLQHLRSLAVGRSPAAAEAQARMDLLADLQRTHLAIQQATGVNVRLLRMPHGIDRPWINAVARDMDYALVNWTYGSDWQPGTADELMAGYLAALKPGAIFLFHDGGRDRTKSLRLAEELVKSAKDQGYDIVTAGQLLGVVPHWERDFHVHPPNSRPGSP